MSIALVTIVKMEELYIQEYIDYYFKLGVTDIYLGDNNDKNYVPSLESSFREDPRIHVYDYRGKFGSQKIFNNRVYNETNHDWYLFFDVDEFLDIKKKKNLKKFLEDEKFSLYNVIRVNWRNYGDNGLIYYDPRPVQERFTTPSVSPKSNNNTIKCIVKGNIPGMRITIHGVGSSKVARRCDVLGNPMDYIRPDSNCDPMIKKYGKNYLKDCYKMAELKHYATKTIDEYYRFKLKRGCALESDNPNYRYNFNRFFFYNERTPEKEWYMESVKKDAENFIKNYMKKYQEWYRNLKK